MGSTRRRWLLAAIASAAIAGCGGGNAGDGANGSAGPSSQATPPPAQLSVSRSSVVAGTSSSQSTDSPITLQVSVANPPAQTLHSSVKWSGAAVAAATLTWQSPASGQLTISFPSPSQQGVGTVTGSVTLSVCTDSACNDPVAGSPVTIPVQYVVTPPPTFYFPQPQTGFEANTSQTSPESTNFQFIIHNLPVQGLWVDILQPPAGFITNVTDTLSPVSNGDLDVTFALEMVSPASLGSGYFSSSVTFRICYDEACTEPISGSPVTRTIYYTVYLTPGVEYSQASLGDDSISDVAYDSATQQLYVCGLGGYSDSISGTVAQVDPLTGSVVMQTPLNDGLSTIAVSSDGSLLYAGSTENPSIYRLSLPSLQQDLVIPLGSMTVTGQTEANTAYGIAPAPGAPQTIAVSMTHPNGWEDNAGTLLFDGAVARAQALAPLGFYAEPDEIVWSDGGTLLYAYQNSSGIPFDQEIDSVSADGSGLAVQSSTALTGSADFVGSLAYEQGNLYERTGYVRAASTGAVVGQFQLPAYLTGDGTDAGQIVAVTPDLAHNRAFVLLHDLGTSRLLLLTYSTSSYSLQSVVNLGYDTFDVAITTHMLLWGTDGVAFNRNGLQIFSGTFMASPAASSVAHALAHRRLGKLHLAGVHPGVSAAAGGQSNLRPSSSIRASTSAASR